MASQTTYYGDLSLPTVNGGRVVMIAGTAKFVSSAAAVSLVVPFTNEVLGFQANFLTHPASKGKILWCTGVISGGRIKVSRSTGTSSGMTFWYKVLGW